MELRAIQKRNRDETIRARKAGEPKRRPSYGYMYVRLAPMAKVNHVTLNPVGAEIIREVARRILADETGKITIGTEAVRLTREGIPSPGDRRAQLYAVAGVVTRGDKRASLNLHQELPANNEIILFKGHNVQYGAPVGDDGCARRRQADRGRLRQRRSQGASGDGYQ